MTGRCSMSGPNDADPGPRRGTRLPRWYPDRDGDERRLPGRPSSIWRVLAHEGSDRTTVIDGSPLGVPQLRRVLQAMFPEAATVGAIPDARPAPPSGRSVDREPTVPAGDAETETRPFLTITWLEDGDPVGSASVYDDGRLVTDERGRRLIDRWLDPSQLEELRRALLAAAPLLEGPTR
jgi:hypothetical protein